MKRMYCALLGLLLAGCGGASKELVPSAGANGGGDRLTKEEAEALFTSMVNEGFASPNAPPPDESPGVRTDTIPCREGGEMVGTTEMAPPVGYALIYHVSGVANACRVPVGDQTFELNHGRWASQVTTHMPTAEQMMKVDAGEPLTLTFEIVSDPHEVAWSDGSRHGVCQADVRGAGEVRVSMEDPETPESTVVTYTGTFCGHSIEVDVEWR